MLRAFQLVPFLLRVHRNFEFSTPVIGTPEEPKLSTPVVSSLNYWRPICKAPRNKRYLGTIIGGTTKGVPESLLRIVSIKENIPRGTPP